MVDTVVTLGGFVFTSWGVPARVNGGGRQKLVVHRLIGGQRVIDVLGWDADRIVFSGRLRGAGAAGNARLLETAARSGNPVVFSYWTNRYQVLVDGFEWQFERYYEVSYQVGLTVLSDLTQDGWIGSDDTLDEIVNADLTAVAGTTGALPGVVSALTAVTAAQTAIGTLQGASPVTLLPLVQAVGAALTVSQTTGASLDAGFPVTAAGGVVGGGDPASLASSLAAQTSGMQQLAASTQTTALLTRVQSNLATAPQ